MQTAQSRELCYVMKTYPFKERDVIAVLFSESRGKFSVLARNGIQSRRFGGAFNLFTCSEFELDSKTIRIAEVSEEVLIHALSAQVKHASSTLSKSFERLSGGSALNELLLRIIPNQRAAPEIFKLYSNALFALDEQPPEHAIRIVNAFILKITQWLGVQPQLTRCLHCEKALNEVRGDTVTAQVANGAWICIDCYPERSPLTLSKTAILDAYHSMLEPIRKIQFQANQSEHETLLEFLEKHLQYFVPGLERAPISSFRFLKSPQLPI